MSDLPTILELMAISPFPGSDLRNSYNRFFVELLNYLKTKPHTGSRLT